MVAEPSRPCPQGGSDRMMALLLKRASASPIILASPDIFQYMPIDWKLDIVAELLRIRW
jgi:hypothetical protein